jgi:competence protein ComEA
VLEPFIEIKHEEQAVTKETSVIPALLVELNTASEEELIKIKGIGEYLAAQIIKYRNRLGGFNSKEQLLEVPKIDSTRYAEISPFIEVNTKAVRKININTASFEQLKQHPYIGYNIALSLINYRTKHGLFNSLEDMKKSALITNQNFPKISYYLCID